MRDRALANRVALVTGGGTGIGRGIALALARRGVALVLAGRRTDRLEAVRLEAQAFGVLALVVPTDLRNPAQRADLVHATRLACGPIGLLVHSAGVLAGGAITTHDEATITNALATNLAAPIDLTRLALPDLVATRGAVVLIGSTLSDVPMPYASLYSATKAGVAAFGTSLRNEVAPLGVHVLTAYPPGTDTAMVHGMAQRAGFGTARLATPEATGERIVQALAAGKTELRWGGGERLLAWLQRLAPGLTQRLLATQRNRLRLMFTPADVTRD
jgi:short-subunit dehydrogenase